MLEEHLTIAVQVNFILNTEHTFVVKVATILANFPLGDSQ